MVQLDTVNVTQAAPERAALRKELCTSFSNKSKAALVRVERLLFLPSDPRPAYHEVNVFPKLVLHSNSGRVRSLLDHVSYTQAVELLHLNGNSVALGAVTDYRGVQSQLCCRPVFGWSFLHLKSIHFSLRWATVNMTGNACHSSRIIRPKVIGHPSITPLRTFSDPRRRRRFRLPGYNIGSKDTRGIQDAVCC